MKMCLDRNFFTVNVCEFVGEKRNCPPSAFTFTNETLNFLIVSIFQINNIKI